MSPLSIVLLVLAIVVLAALVAVGQWAYRRRRLRANYGAEYDRLVEEKGGHAAAAKELRARERRHDELPLHELPAETRDRYAGAWRDAQAMFVETPAQAVTWADQLVTELMGARGYPTGGYEERLAHLSVEHAATLEHYRAAHDISERNARGEADTEGLRRAMVHYRALFTDLLGIEPNGGSRRENAGTAEDTTKDTTRTEHARNADDTVDTDGTARRETAPADARRKER